MPSLHSAVAPCSKSEPVGAVGPVTVRESGEEPGSGEERGSGEEWGSGEERGSAAELAPTAVVGPAENRAPAGEAGPAGDALGELSGAPGVVALTTTVTVRVTVCAGLAVGTATVAVTVTVDRPGAGIARSIDRVEAAGSEWLAPPITTPATTPPAAASVAGRRHQFPVGSTPNMIDMVPVTK